MEGSMYSGALQLSLAITHVCNILLKGFNICCYIWFKFIFVHISSMSSDFFGVAYSYDICTT